MITGFELALAVLPLVISATEHHKKVLRPAEAILSTKRKNEHHLIFYEELYDELALLGNTLKTVGGNLVSRPEAEAFSSLNPDEHDEIERVLGSSAQPFSDHLERLLRSLNDLVSEKSLGLNRSDVSDLAARVMFTKLETFRVDMNQGVSRTTLSDRFRFTRNEMSRRVAMKRIRDANKMLERLLHTSVLSEIYEVQRPIPKKAERGRLRRMSEPLFRKIADKLATACDTHNLHEAKLCLWNCCSHQRQRRAIDSLDLVVSVADVGDFGSYWQESTILITSEDNPSLSQPTVRFQVEEETTSAPLPMLSPKRDIETESLCNLIQRAHVEHSTLQIVFENGRLWQVRSRRNSLRIPRQKDITLKEFLSVPSSHIPLRERYILAVVLAHAALHGSGSSWLSEQWSKEHVSFFKKDDSVRPDLRRPFLKIELDTDAANSNQAKNLWKVNSALESLGILLLEIASDNPIESKYAKEDLNDDGQPNQYTNVTTALRLLDELEYDVVEGYKAAISACLDAEMLSSENAEIFSRAVYDRIVLPLERELENGFHIRPEQFELVPDLTIPVKSEEK
ncbi:hypothetical protein LTS15_005073 [Exophiala xenobiotica]|nr:hypothetical protein LTS15_005073 [Exophiala xenobiotica]